MNRNVWRTLTDEGLDPETIKRIHECKHEFLTVWVFKENDVEGNLELRTKCYECGCTTVMAEMLGLNPENYCEGPEQYV